MTVLWLYSTLDLTRRSNVQQDNTTCGADSFMLRDGVCDDTSNTAKCFFDGGDCCKENKDRGLCRNCACILSINQTEFEERLTASKVKPFGDPEKLNLSFGNSWWQFEVEDVTTMEVCTVVCLDHKLADEINAWHYQIDKKICRCGWIESSSCPEKKVIDNWTWDSNVGLMESQAFIQLNKTVPCGIKNRLYI